MALCRQSGVIYTPVLVPPFPIGATTLPSLYSCVFPGSGALVTQRQVEKRAQLFLREILK